MRVGAAGDGCGLRARGEFLAELARHARDGRDGLADEPSEERVAALRQRAAVRHRTGGGGGRVFAGL
jgi:hypothetical protein